MILLNLSKKNKIIGVAISSLLIIGGVCFSAGNYHVKYVVDGDTIVVERGGKEQNVRFLGINAPEIAHEKYGKMDGECYGQQAKQFLEKQIDGKDILLIGDPQADNTDKYGRILRYVFANGKFINGEMLSNGYAFNYIFGNTPLWFSGYFGGLEKQARKARIGLWSEQCSYYFK